MDMSLGEFICKPFIDMAFGIIQQLNISLPGSVYKGNFFHKQNSLNDQLDNFNIPEIKNLFEQFPSKPVSSSLSFLAPNTMSLLNADFYTNSSYQTIYSTSVFAVFEIAGNRNLTKSRFKNLTTNKLQNFTTQKNNQMFGRHVLGKKDGFYLESIYPKDFGLEINSLLNAGLQIDRGGFTKITRAIEKHSCRIPTCFPMLRGSVTQRNILGEQVLKDILNDSNLIFKKHGSGIVDVYIPNGRGLRYESDGTFRGVLEP